MEISTDVFGIVEYKEEDIITFQEGIPGFETYKRYILIDIEDMPYKSLQSLEDSEFAFTVAPPFAFCGEYDFEVPQRVIEQLDIHSIEDIDMYAIIVLRDPIDDSSMNLKAPLLINNKNKMAKQVVLTEDYPLRFLFLREMEAE